MHLYFQGIIDMFIHTIVPKFKENTEAWNKHENKNAPLKLIVHHCEGQMCHIISQHGPNDGWAEVIVLKAENHSIF